MPRYIDADKAKAWFADRYNVCDFMDSGIIDTLQDAIDEQPTADVVKVVRCKDCNWYMPKTDNTGMCGWWHKDGIKYGVGVIDYCSMGRKDGD